MNGKMKQIEKDLIEFVKNAVIHPTMKELMRAFPSRTGWDTIELGEAVRVLVDSGRLEYSFRHDAWFLRGDDRLIRWK